MPYLENSDNHVWFLVYIKNNLVGFGSVKMMKNKAVLSHSYIQEENRRQGIWKEINKKRLEYAQKVQKPVEVITKEPYLKDYWISQGFSVYRTNGKYYYLRRDNGES